MKRTVWFWAAFTFLLAFALGNPTLSRADSIENPLGEVATIQNNEGDARILFKSSTEFPREGAIVSRATIRVPIVGNGTEREVRLEIHPVTRAWSAGAVSWNSGWETPGGDFNRDLFAEVAADLGRTSTVTFDVTPLVKEIVEEGVFADGFILTVHPGDGVGLRGEDVNALNQIGSADLEIKSKFIGVRTKEIRR